MSSASVTGESLIYKQASIVVPLRTEDLFSVPQSVEVELGAGDGSFLAAYAKGHPEINLIGVERLLGRIRKIDRKGRRLGLRNLRLVRIEASYFARYLLPKESTSAVHIYFPDPWPKRRHWKNRLINESFTEILRAALTPRGRVYLRTDDQHYFEQMIRSFDANTNFAKIETPVELLEIKTDFERGFHAKGVPTLHASYQRVV